MVEIDQRQFALEAIREMRTYDGKIFLDVNRILNLPHGRLSSYVKVYLTDTLSIQKSK